MRDCPEGRHATLITDTVPVHRVSVTQLLQHVTHPVTEQTPALNSNKHRTDTVYALSGSHPVVRGSSQMGSRSNSSAAVISVYLLWRRLCGSLVELRDL